MGRLWTAKHEEVWPLVQLLEEMKASCESPGLCAAVGHDVSCIAQ